MRKLQLILLLTAVQCAAAATGEYSVVVAENGNALVLIGLEGEGTVNIPLPLDVSYPEVYNALYVESADGIEVSLPGNESATIAYQTSMATSKTGSGWTLDLDLGGGYSALVSLPKTARIKRTQPQAYVSETEDSKHVSFTLADNVRVEYDFTSTPVSPTTTLKPQAPTTTLAATTTTRKTTTTQPPGGDGGLPVVVYAAAAFLVLAGAAGAAILFLRGRGPSEGMRKAMRTLSGNEYKVVDTLLKHKGGMRRSELERTAGISKSSLAVALNSLERKNIVEVDRANTTHYVEVTKWFREL
jgi:uncharacterized membrane protein